MTDAIQKLMREHGITFKACRADRYLILEDTPIEGKIYMVTEHPYRKKPRIMYEGPHEEYAIRLFLTGE